MTEITPVEVTMHLAAGPEDVFRFFTDPARYVQWMGSQAELEPVPGGVYHVRMPDGFEAAGQFLQLDRPHLVVFSWGFADDQAAARTKHEGGEAGGMARGWACARSRSGAGRLGHRSHSLLIPPKLATPQSTNGKAPG